MSEQIVYQSDLTEFVGVLANASGRDAQRVTEQVVHMMGEEIALLARANAPRDTGELADSITALHGPMTTQVVARAPHAAFVEFGTWSHNVLNPKPGTYEIRPVRANSLKFTAADGRVVHTQLVRHPGIKPQPFLGPAHEAVIDEFTRGVAAVGVTLVVGP